MRDAVTGVNKNIITKQRSTTQSEIFENEYTRVSYEKLIISRKKKITSDRTLTDEKHQITPKETKNKCH